MRTDYSQIFIEDIDSRIGETVKVYSEHVSSKDIEIFKNEALRKYRNNGNKMSVLEYQKADHKLRKIAMEGFNAKTN